MADAAMTPHGLALRAFFEGDRDACLLTRRDDGFEAPIPVHHFFRDPAAFSPLERAALDACRGSVLDVGAGSGLHALALQNRGGAVTALDISPDAVAIMRARGVRDVREGDVMTFRGGPFDTLLMLGHGVGMTGTLRGLETFLRHATGLLHPGGQLLLDSLDARRTDDPRHRAYHESNEAAGRYAGEIRMRLVFRDHTGPPVPWLHVDPDTLASVAGAAGFVSARLLETEHGEYLARLVLREPE